MGIFHFAPAPVQINPILNLRIMHIACEHKFWSCCCRRRRRRRRNKSALKTINFIDRSRVAASLRDAKLSLRHTAPSVRSDEFERERARGIVSHSGRRSSPNHRAVPYSKAPATVCCFVRPEQLEPHTNFGAFYIYTRINTYLFPLYIM